MQHDKKTNIQIVDMRAKTTEVDEEFSWNS
jgi:hypothetical protein